MTITIKAFDANNDGLGLDFSKYLANFDANFVRSGYGYFSDNPSDLGGDEYAVSSSSDTSLPFSDGQSVVMDSGAAGDFAYNMASHTVGGTLDTVEFGSGLAYNAAKDDFTTAYDMRIAGLGLSGAGASNEVSTLIDDLMNGNIAVLNAHLASESFVFAGSESKDAFVGLAGRDLIRGNGGNDVLNGGAGSDSIFGGDGNDKITGAAGNDGMAGGAGNDIFVFASKFGSDRINDFDAGAAKTDVIWFATTVFTDFQDVLDHAQDSGADTIITVNATTKLTLYGVHEADLHANDFLFV